QPNQSRSLRPRSLRRPSELRHGMSGKARKRRWRHDKSPPSVAAGGVTGTLVQHPAACQPVIEVIAYGPERFIEKQCARPDELREFLGRWPVVWVNVDGLGDGRVICEVGQLFGLHHLAMEDVVHVHQRAKVEEYGEHTFIV